MTLDAGLAVGDFLPDFPLLNPRQGRTTLLRRVRGKAIVLLFYPDGRMPACQGMLRAFADVYPRLDELAHVFVITRESREASARTVELTGLSSVPMLCDPDGQLARVYGVEHNMGGARDFAAPGAFTGIVAGPSQRIVRIDRDIGDTGYPSELIAFLGAIAKEPARRVRPFAPVLYVPGVFDRDFRRYLMDVCETQGSELTGVNRSYGAAGVDVKDTAVKVRRDHTVQDPTLCGRINRFIARRVVPEVSRAFGHRITHAEAYMIGCYEHASGGYFRPHRDNVSQNTRHRRFAMSVNLNTGDYEGGELRFPEYGPHLYSPAAGDAIVFSCSLLHEALPVTAGRRFVLLTFFYGAEGREIPGTLAIGPG